MSNVWTAMGSCKGFLTYTLDKYREKNDHYQYSAVFVLTYLVLRVPR